MAERATADRVASDMRPANYRGAVQRLRTIEPKKKRIAGINGEISGIYDAVEGFKVNKKAARIFLTLDGLEPEEQQDIFRSLVGLIDVAGWAKGDLVDQAEGGNGNIVAADFGRRAKADSTENAAGEDSDVAKTMDEIDQMPAGDGSGDDGPDGSEPEAPADEPAPTTGKKRGNGLTPAEARAKAKAHFEKGEPNPSVTTTEPEPYTGDNSDLAPE